MKSLPAPEPSFSIRMASSAFCSFDTSGVNSFAPLKSIFTIVIPSKLRFQIFNNIIKKCYCASLWSMAAPIMPASLPSSAGTSFPCVL